MICFSGRVVLSDAILENGFCIIEGDTIVKITDDQAQVPKGCPVVAAPIVMPGLVDIHNHGMGGHPDMVHYWENPLYTAKAAARLGTTSLLATLVLPKETAAATHRLVDSLNQVVGKYHDDCAIIEGLHAEGPVIADFGGLPASDVDMPLPDFRALVDHMQTLRVMTISPSKDAEANYDRIRYLLSRNVTPALGHDRNCTAEQVLGALRVDPSQRLHITHMFNVSSFSHRDASLANFGMVSKFPTLPAYDGLQPPSVEIIADGQHLHPLTIQAVLDARAAEHVACVTDCVAENTCRRGAADAAVGVQEEGREILYNGRSMMVIPPGKVVLKGTATLAGSCAASVDMLRRLVQEHGMSLVQCGRLLCSTPATVARLPHVGALEVGKKANIILLTATLDIQAVYVHGHCVSP
eukprot:NODE_303_length_1505_cov_370.941621_g218_i0.p1 GENE.NODE_303_length_1505_cov_370.941621_g218_i0~~NODE_303_length_1505_cov_370.941621_g218_i0.p1  ORF type:complete len:410 (+),score=110.38 NODE_303_length_1505_cov_370.941621_g218_i0:57-1286(+)